MSKKCVFCAIQDNGDIADDHKSLIEKEVSLKTIVKLDITHKYFGRSVKRKSEIVIPYESEEIHGYPVFDVYVDGTGTLWSYLTDNEGLNVFEYYKKINYCPMCGRKLGGDVG